VAVVTHHFNVQSGIVVAEDQVPLVVGHRSRGNQMGAALQQHMIFLRARKKWRRWNQVSARFWDMFGMADMFVY
jgi:hypothetical protein